MHVFARLSVAAVFFGLFLSPALAQPAAPSPVGAWQSADGQARVRVTMCGDGTQLCARLIGLSGAARTARNLELLNTYVVDRARPSEANVWEGVVHFNGQTATGHITLVSARLINVSGCQLGMCRTFQFQRISNRVASAAADDTRPLPQIPPRTVGLTLPE